MFGGHDNVDVSRVDARAVVYAKSGRHGAWDAGQAFGVAEPRRDKKS